MMRPHTMSLIKCVEERDNDILLNIEVRPGSKFTGISGINEWRNAIEIHVKSRAEKGEANREIIDLLSAILGVSTSDLEIMKGRKSRRKVIKILRNSKENMLIKLESELESFKTP